MFTIARSAEKFVIANFPITQQTNTYFTLQELSQKESKTQLRQDYPLFVSKDSILYGLTTYIVFHSSGIIYSLLTYFYFSMYHTQVYIP